MNVIIMATIGYGHRFSANATKCEYVAKALLREGASVTMLNCMEGTRGIDRCSDFIATSGLKTYDFKWVGPSKFYKNYSDLKKVLKSLYKKGEPNHIIIEMQYLQIFLAECYLAKKIGYKVSVLFHEYHRAFHYNHKIQTFESFIKDNIFGYFVDGIFPISHFLEDKAKRFKKPMMMLPILSGYDRELTTKSIGNHFTMCCSALYLLRMPLFLEAFRIVAENRPSIKIALIIGGNERDADVLKKKVEESSLSHFIEIKRQIPQIELYKTYDSSIGLLVPLEPDNIQDIARFSQKIAEYIEAKRPMITSSVGEIPYYFKDKETYVNADFTAEGYADAMIWLIDNPEKANTIGENGYKVGMQNFDYKQYGPKLVDFINRLA